MTRVEILTQLIAHELIQKAKAVGKHPDKGHRPLTMEETYTPSCYLMNDAGCKCYIGALMTASEIEEVRASMGHLSVSVSQMWDRDLVPSFFARVGVSRRSKSDDLLEWDEEVVFLVNIQSIHDMYPLHNDRVRELRDQLAKAREKGL